MFLSAVTTRRANGVVILLQILLTVATGRAEEATKEFVRMPLRYDKGIVVVVSSEGAAGVRFFDPFELANETGNGIIGISYEWRYLERKPNAEPQTGSGRVFAKLVAGAVDHGSFVVSCGPMRTTWGHTDKESGVLQYDPYEMAVHPVAVEYFAERDVEKIPAVDLRRFLYSNEESNREHFAEVYSGPDTEPRRYNGDTAGPVFYENRVLVVRDAFGIATFKFGPSFERDQSQDEKHYGVSYEFTFTSHDFKSSQAGAGEVYEKYTNGNYNGGRLYLEAGPVHVAWSRGGHDLGWVYYDPSWTRIWNVDSADSESLVNAVKVADSF